MTNAAIMPDGSVVLRGEKRILRFDKTHREVIVRALMENSEHGGSVLATYQGHLADRLRLIRQGMDRYHLYLELITDRQLDLGEYYSHTMAMRIAWQIADIIKTEVWVEDENDPRPDDEPTTPIPYATKTIDYDPMPDPPSPPPADRVTMLVDGLELDGESTADLPETYAEEDVPEPPTVEGQAPPKVIPQVEVEDLELTDLKDANTAVVARRRVTAVIAPRKPTDGSDASDDAVNTVVATALDPLTAITPPLSIEDMSLGPFADEDHVSIDDVYVDEEPTEFRPASTEERVVRLLDADDRNLGPADSVDEDEDPTGPDRPPKLVA